MKLLWWKHKTPELHYRFEPQPDITAHELAILMPLLRKEPYRTQAAFRARIEALPPECARHVKVL